MMARGEPASGTAGDYMPQSPGRAEIPARRRARCAEDEATTSFRTDRAVPRPFREHSFPRLKHSTRDRFKVTRGRVLLVAGPVRMSGTRSLDRRDAISTEEPPGSVTDPRGRAAALRVGTREQRSSSAAARFR